MKKKNVLFIVIDSVSNTQLFNSVYSKNIAPFLNKLRYETISGDKMYSQAPYTEAALMSLLGSCDTMDNGGYMKKFKNRETIIDVFSNNGYKTYFPTYYPSVYPSYMYYGAEEVNYIEKFTFSHLWDYRFDYFKEFYLKDETTPMENKLLFDMLEDNLNAWIELLDLLEKKDGKTILMNDCIDRDTILKVRIEVSKELDKFISNKKEYLRNLFLEDRDHVLFKINSQCYTDKIHNDEYRKWFLESYKEIFNKIYKKQIKYNLKNGKFPVKKLFKNINNKQVVKGLIAGYKNLIFDKDIKDRISINFDLFKAQRSFRTVADLTMEWIKNNNDDEKPWMAYVHVDDAHYPENFFTYDTDNKEIVKQEFLLIDKYLDNLPKKYCGTISSDLSLLYCDNIIKNIFEFLNNNNLLDSTSVVITADHGFSYYFSPVREKYVISSYRENYNVPFIIYDKSIQPKMINNYVSTKEIPATLLDLAGIRIPKEFKGKSLLDYEGTDYALLEYMGGGCPDIVRRPIVLGVRTDNYDVIMEIYINKAFKDNEIKEIYDIKKDPFQNNNLINKKNIRAKIINELLILENRYNEIIKEYRSK